MTLFKQPSGLNQWVKRGVSLFDQAKTTVRKHTTRRTLAGVITNSPDDDQPIIEIIMPFSQQQGRLANQLSSAKAQPPQVQGQKGSVTKRPPINLKRQLKVSAISLGLSAGGLVFPILGIVGGAGLAYGVFGVFKMTYNQLKHGVITVDILVSGTMLGCILSGSFLIGNTAAFIFLSSLWMVNKVKADTRQHLADVFGQAPQFVWVLLDGTEVSLPFSQLQAGHIVVVETGETIPADGVVVEGIATVDQHILTGEARPVERGMGEKVFASTVILSGKIHLRVEKAGQETTVER